MPIQTILLAVDPQPESRPLIDYTFALAERLGAVVHTVYAYPIVVVPTRDGTGTIPYEALHERARERLRQATASHDGSPSMGKRVVDLGEPSTIIGEMASELRADLLVVGTHAARGMQRWLVGSVAEAVLRGAHVPTLVVRTPHASDLTS